MSVNTSVGTIGINSDYLNISGTTNINNIIVSGTTSFPANSIASSAISGGGGGLTLTNNSVVTLNYIPFTTQTTGIITAANTDSGLTYNASSNVLGCGGLSTTGNITLPSTSTNNYTAFFNSNTDGSFGTISGQLGNIQNASNNVASSVNFIWGNSLGSAGVLYTSKVGTLNLSVGVWLICGEIQFTQTSTAITNYSFGLSINNTNSGFNTNCSVYQDFNNAAYYKLFGGASMGISNVVCVTTAASYYLMFGVVAASLTNKSNFSCNYGQYYAVRIA